MPCLASVHDFFQIVYHHMYTTVHDNIHVTIMYYVRDSNYCMHTSLSQLSNHNALTNIIHGLRQFENLYHVSYALLYRLGNGRGLQIATPTLLVTVDLAIVK